MIKYLMNHFALTETGAKQLKKASLLSFLTFFVNMTPMFVIMFTIQGILDQNIASYYVYGSIVVGIDLLLRIVYTVSYDALYTAVFSEAKVQRLNASKKLKELPLSYLYKHDS